MLVTARGPEVPPLYAGKFIFDQLARCSGSLLQRVAGTGGEVHVSVVTQRWSCRGVRTGVHIHTCSDSQFGSSPSVFHLTL